MQVVKSRELQRQLSAVEVGPKIVTFDGRDVPLLYQSEGLRPALPMQYCEHVSDGMVMTGPVPPSIRGVAAF